MTELKEVYIGIYVANLRNAVAITDAGRERCVLSTDLAVDGSALRAAALVFLPDPQGHGSFRPILMQRRGRDRVRDVALGSDRWRLGVGKGPDEGRRQHAGGWS
jgi:hypothetical protein